MVVVVTGGRDYANRAVVYRALDAEHEAEPISLLVSGCADGADTLALQWAESRRVKSAREPIAKADWKTYGGGAGPIRNQRMIDNHSPQKLVAFPGMRGTADMLSRCYGRIPVVWAGYEGFPWFSLTLKGQCGAVLCDPQGLVRWGCPLYVKRRFVGRALNDIIRENRPHAAWSRLASGE